MAETTNEHVKGLRDPDGQLYQFIPPIATEKEFGGITAIPRTTENKEVVIDPTTGRLYVGSTEEQIDNITHYITPEMFGAKGDGVTDDSEAIQTAINTAVETATNAYYVKPIVYLAAKTYKINTGLVLDSRCLQFVCDGVIEYTGIGMAVSVMHSYINVYINSISAPNGTALYLTGAEHQCIFSNIKINRITKSVRGVYLHNHGEANSVFYNKIDIGYITSTDKCVELYSELGYINENFFWFSKLDSAEVAIKIHRIVSGGVGVGTNRFFKGSFENLANTDQDDSLMADINTVALWLENTGNNTFANFRCEENYGRTNVKFAGSCSYNDIGLSTVQLGAVDTTAMTGGNGNILRGTVVQTGNALGGGHNCGDKAIVSYNHGVTYDPKYADIDYEVTADTFADKVIKQIYIRYEDLRIPTVLSFDDTVNGEEFTLGSLYSERGSLARGFSLVLKFGATTGRILLKDSRGGTILDNTNGKYANSSLSVRWNGYDKYSTHSIWDIQKLGVDRESTDNKVTTLSVSSNNEQYPTARCVYNAIKANEPKELDFTMTDGALVITPKMRNLVSSSIDTDGSIYEKYGYVDGYRINSSGNQVLQNGTAITGFMDCEGIVDDDTIYVGGLKISDLQCGVAFYDADFNIIQCLRLKIDGSIADVYVGQRIAYAGVAGSSVTTNENGIVVIKINFDEYQCNLTPPKYFRIYAEGGGSNAVVTLNEEIKEFEKAVVKLGIPTKTSELENDKNFITNEKAETWTFTMSDGSTVTKKVVLV